MFPTKIIKTLPIHFVPLFIQVKNVVWNSEQQTMDITTLGNNIKLELMKSYWYVWISCRKWRKCTKQCLFKMEKDICKHLLTISPAS